MRQRLFVLAAIGAGATLLGFFLSAPELSPGSPGSQGQPAAGAPAEAPDGASGPARESEGQPGSAPPRPHPMGPSDPSLPRSKAVTEAQCEGAMELPAMASIDPKDARYDPVVEAEQAFHPFEQALIAARPLTPPKWKGLLDQFREQNGKVIGRAGDLRRAGHADDAREFMEEWSRIYGLYQAEAYDRAPPPHKGSPADQQPPGF